MFEDALDVNHRWVNKINDVPDPYWSWCSCNYTKGPDLYMSPAWSLYVLRYWWWIKAWFCKAVSWCAGLSITTTQPGCIQLCFAADWRLYTESLCISCVLEPLIYTLHRTCTFRTRRGTWCLCSVLYPANTRTASHRLFDKPCCAYAPLTSRSQARCSLTSP